MKNIPLLINNFYLGDVLLDITDSGNGISLNNINIDLNTEDCNEFRTGQLQLLIDSLPIGIKLMSLSSDDIDRVIQELEQIKLSKV